MSSEKVSFNISVVDLGKIHLLVENGIYTNRTDFITKAILNELNRNTSIIEKAEQKSNVVLGILSYSKDNLEKLVKSNTKLSIYLIGMLIIDKDVTLELAESAISKITVYGKYNGPENIKKHFNI